MAAIDPAYFERVYASIHLDEGSKVALLGRDSTLIAGYPHHEEGIAKQSSNSLIFRHLNAAAAPSPQHGLLRTSVAEPELIAYREVTGLPLVIVVTESENMALANWRHQALLLVGGAAAVISLLTLAAWALSRKLAREETLTIALHDSELRLQGIIGSAMDAIITVDETGRIVLFNPAAETMFRCPQAAALGTSLDRFIPERYQAAHGSHMQRFGTTNVPLRNMGGRLDIIACRADGEEFPADISISQLKTDGHTLYTAMVCDVTRRKAAEDELRASHQQLRELSTSLQSVREEERTRIARELHDELGQHLTGLKMDLSWLELRLPKEQPAVAAKVADMNQLLDTTVQSVRRLAAELRPSILDNLGLVAAIEWLGEDFSQRSGAKVDLELDQEELVENEELVTALFRIVQEALTNISRHAEASRVRIALKHVGGSLTLEIEDNGRGMPLESGSAPGHFGLIGIRERAYLFGGDMRITSKPGAGTTIVITLPLTNPVEASV